MKKITKYITVIFLVQAILFSCTDLEEKIYDQLPADEFGATSEQVNAIFGPAYASLRVLTDWAGVFGIAGCTSDEMIAPTRLGGDWWDGGEYMNWNMHLWNPNSFTISTLWSHCMSGVTTVNSIIASIETNTVLDDDTRERYIAELRGLRAFWFYMLCDYFGNVPVVTDYEDTELPTVTPRAEVYKYVVDELIEVIPLLRTDVSSESYGKFTQGAARAVLAKMYLNAAEWIGTANWEGVITQCDAIMRLDYIIEPIWKTNFAIQNENSLEAILPIPFSKTSGWPANEIHLYTLHYQDPIALGFKAWTWNGYCAKPDLVKSFDNADKRKAGTFLTGPMIDPETGDVLITDVGNPLIHTVDFAIIPKTEKTDAYGRSTPWGEVNQEDGARICKWEFEKGSSNTPMENDVSIFRLADIYLMKAEALVRLGQDNAEATRLVNEIRERGFGDDQHNLASVTLEDIYKERRFELSFEFMGRQDMIRFGKFLNPGYLKPYVSEDYRKLMPIPVDAYQTNNKLVQNPGYPKF